MFIDELEILVQSGRGGHGCASFRREKYVPFGGPDGGDGGRGGSVMIAVNPALNTLLPLRNRRHYRAKNGSPGEPSNRTGASAEDLTLFVPRGTLVRDVASGTLLADLTGPEDRVEIARGGRGGKGNARFVSSIRQAPRFAQEGEPGQEVRIRLELKLMADVGLVGLPNSGKSTLISRLSSAKPKIADYPFTTLKPSLGVVRAGSDESFVVADIPGLIRDAHQGSGLGIRFLRHIERTRVLLMTLDPSDPVADVVDAFDTLMAELESYRSDLSKKPKMIALTKHDLPVRDPDAVARLKRRLDAHHLPYADISAVSGVGIDGLIHRLYAMVQDATRNAAQSPPEKPQPKPESAAADPLDEL